MMKKIVYSLLLFLSVSCSSAATQSASTPEKKVETASQAKIIPNQSKDFVAFAIQWREDVSWLLINIYLVFYATYVGEVLLNNWEYVFTGIGENSTFAKLLTFFIFPLVVTCIAAVLNTYLHFTNGEKEGKRLAFTKHFLAKWLPTVLVTAFTALLNVPFIKRNFLKILSIKKKNYNLIFLPLVFACLIVAPITPYLISCLKLTSDDTIKRQKKAQKPSFFKQWIFYDSSMVIYQIIIKWISIVVNFVLFSNLNKNRRGDLIVIILVAITGLNTWISYISEKEKMPSEQKALRRPLLRSFLPALLSLVCLLFVSSMRKRQMPAKFWTSKVNLNNFLTGFIYPNLICGMIIVPIFVVIERYMFEESVQRDSSKKSRKKAQTKELNETYNQARSLSKS